MQISKKSAVWEWRPKYNDFKRKTFQHAVDEINSQYEIDLTFTEYNDEGEKAKPKQKVVAIRFDFKPTFIRRAVDPRTGKARNVYTKPKKKTDTNDTNLKQHELISSGND